MRSYRESRDEKARKKNKINISKKDKKAGDFYMNEQLTCDLV